MLDTDTVDFYFEFVLNLIKQAGDEIRNVNDVIVETKDVSWDLVTQYDRKVEEVLVDGIKKQFSNHKFISEEDCADKRYIPELTDDPTWIIDPIDGTANFIRKIPITCISVGLLVDKRHVLGIVYNPFTEELYSAIEGRGAFLNGKKLTTSKEEDIGKSIINYELSLARNDEFRELYLSRFKHLIGVIQGVRSMGCAAMGLCYVAKGITDAYQCDGLYPWDAAAGVLIVREAGGYVCDSTGSEFNVMKPNFIATGTKELAKQYVDVMQKADKERMQMERQKLVPV